MYKLFMEFDNPTEDFLGKHHPVQGFAIHENIGFVLFHTGACAAYNLDTKERKPISVFKLGSYNEGLPDNRYTNHANDAMFGKKPDGEDFPLMYVTAGNSGEQDEKGYIAYCAVEQIKNINGVFSSETVQRIYYKNDGIEKTSYQTPGWGWPASLVDVNGGWYYMFSSRYRTKREFLKPDSVFIVTKFRLPDPTVGDVTLYPSDIVDQFELPFNTFFTQGGTIHDNKIWYTFGCGPIGYPNTLRVADLSEKKFTLCEDLPETLFADDEVECCAFYGNRLLINTNKCKLYERL